MRIKKSGLLISFLLGLSLQTKAQYNVHHSVWFDEFTIQHHLNQYLSNSLFSYDYYQKWNKKSKKFESAILERLTFLPFASNEIQIVATELEFNQLYFLLKWENFDPEKVDSLAKKSNVFYSTNLNYDSLGRLYKSTFLNYEHKPYGQRIDYELKYFTNDSTNGFIAKVTSGAGLIVKLKKTNQIRYDFKNRQLIQVAYTHHDPNENYCFVELYTYDSLGRIQTSRRTPKSEVYLDRNYDYVVKHFHLNQVKDEYYALKIPSIQHWLRSYNDTNLSIVAFQKFERNRNAFVEYSYLVDSEQNKLMMLRPYPSYYAEYQDSNSITKAYCSISNSQNLFDTIPFDPNYEPRYIGTFYSQCSVEERYTTPPGLVNAGSVEVHKKSEFSLPNNWKRVTYQRGAGTPYRFAPGFPILDRFDIPNDMHLILDENGTLRYIVDYNKLIRIEELSKGIN